MTPDLDALHECVADLKRRAAQHKPTRKAWRRLHKARTAQLRRYVAKRKLEDKAAETDGFLSRWIASFGKKIGRAA